MTGLSRKRAIVLVRGAGAPLYRQIYDHFRTAIGVGQLQPGDRLPSARRLAEEFTTARGTVDAAYAMLAGEGYVVSRGPAGTMVSPDLREECLKWGVSRKKCLYIPNAIDLPSYARQTPTAEAKRRLGLSPNQTVIGGVGSVSRN